MSQQQLLDPGKASKKPSTRRALDRYLSPTFATTTLIERVPELEGDALYDPTCGDGRMAKQIYETGHFQVLQLNDIDPNAPCNSHEDATQPAAWHGFGESSSRVFELSWCATNPPWKVSGQIAWQALQHARVGVALLLRITWLEPCAGREWLKRLPPTRMIVLPRISYDGSGSTDSATSAWFVWLRGSDGRWKKGGIEVTDGLVGQQELLHEEGTIK